MPGMKVMQFAFDDPWNAYLPHNHERNCICYSGTHDNNTLAGWYAGAEEKERDFVEQYLGVRDDVEAVCRAVMRSGMSSVADLFVAQMQDYLGLGAEARINIPGVAKGNWGWRMASGAATLELAKEIKEMTHTFARC